MGPDDFVIKFKEAFIDPFILLLFALGFLVFVYGVVEYIWGLSSDTEAKKTGRQHLLWGIIGMFIMAGAYGIFSLYVDIVGGSLPGTSSDVDFDSLLR